MDKQDILKIIERIGVVPVIRAESPDNVIRAVEALVEGSIPVAEITMKVPDAVKVIERCVAHFGDRGSGYFRSRQRDPC
ncbi:MAG: hypothetical protein NTU74_19940 [Deltaproteobacteria bacterium]|nr:hypothetical protein [Deltaproteobacteria bacterium]